MVIILKNMSGLVNLSKTKPCHYIDCCLLSGVQILLIWWHLIIWPLASLMNYRLKSRIQISIMILLCLTILRLKWLGLTQRSWNMNETLLVQWRIQSTMTTLVVLLWWLNKVKSIGLQKLKSWMAICMTEMTDLVVFVPHQRLDVDWFKQFSEKSFQSPKSFFRVLFKPWHVMTSKIKLKKEWFQIHLVKDGNQYLLMPVHLIHVNLEA